MAGNGDHESLSADPGLRHSGAGVCLLWRSPTNVPPHLTQRSGTGVTVFCGGNIISYALA